MKEKPRMLQTHGPLTLETFLLQMQEFWVFGIDRVSSGAFGMTYGYGLLEPFQLTQFARMCQQTEWTKDEMGNEWIVQGPVLQFPG